VNPKTILLKKLKDNSCFSLKILADRTGLSQPYLSNVLRGKKNVNDNTLEKILKLGFRLKKDDVYGHIKECSFREGIERLYKINPIKAGIDLRSHSKQKLFEKYKVTVVVLPNFLGGNCWRPLIQFYVRGQNKFNYFMIFFPLIKNERHNKKSKGIEIIGYGCKGENEQITPLELNSLLKDDLKKLLTLFYDQFRKQSNHPSEIARNACQVAINELKLYMAMHYFQPQKKLKGINFSDFL
jgi:transcriptional regulator with XRE-family HTH domain